MPSLESHSIKLWYSPGACSFAPHVVLLETDLEFELVLEQVNGLSEKFLEINPKGRVPVLAIDDAVITETPAIFTAISLLKPDRRLLGQNDIETCRVYEWLNYLSGTLHTQGYGALWRPNRFVDDAALHPHLEKKALTTIKDCYSYIETRLKSTESQYAVGDSFTVVDPYLLLFYLWGNRIGLHMAEEYPELGALADRLLQREAVKRARDVHDRV